jgi:hypothetical protein
MQAMLQTGMFTFPATASHAQQLSISLQSPSTLHDGPVPLSTGGPASTALPP